MLLLFGCLRVGCLAMHAFLLEEKLSAVLDVPKPKFCKRGALACTHFNCY